MKEKLLWFQDWKEIITFSLFFVVVTFLCSMNKTRFNSCFKNVTKDIFESFDKSIENRLQLCFDDDVVYFVVNKCVDCNLDIQHNIDFFVHCLVYVQVSLNAFIRLIIDDYFLSNSFARHDDDNHKKFNKQWISLILSKQSIFYSTNRFQSMITSKICYVFVQKHIVSKIEKNNANLSDKSFRTRDDKKSSLNIYRNVSLVNVVYW